MKRTVALLSRSGLATLLLAAASCFLTTVDAGAQSVTDPVALAKARIEQSCLKVEYPENFAKWGDLNGDGRDDVVITYSVSCDGYSGAFCGLEGCEGGVYVEDGLGGYLDTGLPPDVEPTEWKGWPAVTVRTHGSNCGRTGPKACESLRVWDGSAFVRPTNAMARGKPSSEAVLASAGGGDDDTALAPLTGDEQAELQRSLISNPGATRESIHRQILAERPSGFEPAPVLASDSGGAKEIANQAAAGAGRVAERFDAAYQPLDPDAPETPDEPDAAEEPDQPDDVVIEPHSEGWVFVTRSGGGYGAEVLGQDGRSLLRIACVPGQPSFSVTFSPSQSGSARSGALIMVDFWVGRRISQSRLMSVENGVWRDAIQPYSRLLGDLRRGVWLTLSEPGRRTPLAEFALRGSSQAIGDLIAACRV